MKILLWLLGGILLLTVLFGGMQYLASERVEVVELYTLDENGEEVTTRLWIVDDEGFPYLRVGTGSSGWLERLQNNDTFRVQRNGETAEYTAVFRPDKQDRINQLMQEKYTWGDSFISFVLGSREGAMPVELHRLRHQF